MCWSDKFRLVLFTVHFVKSGAAWVSPTSAVGILLDASTSSLLVMGRVLVHTAWNDCLLAHWLQSKTPLGRWLFVESPKNLRLGTFKSFHKLSEKMAPGKAWLPNRDANGWKVVLCWQHQVTSAYSDVFWPETIQHPNLLKKDLATVSSNI